MTLSPVVVLSPAGGDHVYAEAPEAMSNRESPSQIFPEEGVIFTEVTVTGTVTELLHPLVEPVTVYVVLVPGFAITVLPEVVFSPADGDHV